MERFYSFGPLGLNLLTNINFQIERYNDHGLPVEAISFEIDDYFPGIRGFDGRTELLSGAEYPACASASVATGMKGVPVYEQGVRDPHDPELFTCDARWIADEDYVHDTSWQSLPASSHVTEPATMLFHQENPDMLLDYSFYDYTSGSFHKSQACSFTAGDKATVPSFMWTPLNGPVCFMGVFVLSADPRAYSLLSVETDVRTLTVYYDKGAIVTRSQNHPISEEQPPTEVGNLTLSNNDIGIPVVIGLRYRTDTESLETFVKRGGKNNPLQTSNYKFPPGLMPLKWEVLPSELEKRVEILDAALWRKECWNKVFADAISGYTKGYGI